MTGPLFLTGNVTALGASLIVTVVLSYIYPQDFDWQIMREGIRVRYLPGLPPHPVSQAIWLSCRCEPRLQQPCLTCSI
jgi:hypothetical protein